MRLVENTLEKEIRNIVGNDFNNIELSLIEVNKNGDILSNVSYDIERFISKVENIQIEDLLSNYEMRLGCWFGSDSDEIPNKWNEVEEAISDLIGLNVHQYKKDEVEDELPF